jgi:hypothetical protein
VTFARRWHWFEGAAGHSVELLPDQSYLVSGETQIDSVNDGMVVLRADSLGDTTTVSQFSGYDAGSGLLCRTADSGYVVVGTRAFQVTVSKYAANGGGLWTWGSPYAGLVSAVIPTFDSACLIVGRIPDSLGNFGMVKATAGVTGSWMCYYLDARIMGSFARGAAQTRDSGFILCGDCYDYEGPYLRLLRTDANGDTLWNRLYTWTSGLYFPAVCEAADSGFLLAGSELDSTGHNVLGLLRTNPRGDTVWSRVVAWPGAQTSASALAMTRDGGYIIAGQVEWSDSARVWLVKLDSAGDTQWSSILPGLLRENAASVRQTPDQGYVVVGTSLADSQSLLLYKTDSLGRIASAIAEQPLTPDPRSLTPSLRIAPNPSTTHCSLLTARYSLPAAGHVRLELFDVSGKLVGTLVNGYHAAGAYSCSLVSTRCPLACGVYLVELIAGTDRVTRKLILE